MWNLLRNRFASLRLGGPSPQKKKPLPEILFLPVIFANGRDDDSEGVKAFYENRPYVWQGAIYPPTNEPRTLSGLSICTRYGRFLFLNNGRIEANLGLNFGLGLPIDVSHGIERVISHGTLRFNAPVQP